MTSKDNTTTTTNNKKMTVLSPMVPVPDALRIVLEETNRIVQSNNDGVGVGGSSEKIRPKETVSLLSNSSSYSSFGSKNLVGRVLASDVVMTEPGYPPYNASIMDGYAIRCSEFQKSEASEGEDEKVQWTHRVIDKVFAGDEKDQQGRIEAKDDDTSKCLPGAYYITTGAVVPDVCDCVVPIE